MTQSQVDKTKLEYLLSKIDEQIAAMNIVDVQQVFDDATSGVGVVLNGHYYD